MGTLMVALRWDGHRISRQELMSKASKAVNAVGDAFNHIDKLDIKAVPDEDGQYVQLIIQTDANASDSDAMQQMLKNEFSRA